MKPLIPTLLLAAFSVGILRAQQFKFRKGVVIDSVSINDSIPESFALYLPTTFENSGKWPVIFVFDLEGRGRQALSLMVTAAEKEHYILAASNCLSDSLPISGNILIATRMFNRVLSIFPIHNNRVYTAGFSGGGKFAGIMPSFVNRIEGVLSCAAAVPNTDILNDRNRFHFIGIVGREDFNYLNMLEAEKMLNKINFPNQLLVHEGGETLPDAAYLEKAMALFTLEAMARGNAPEDKAYIERRYSADLQDLSRWITNNQFLAAETSLSRMIEVYRNLKNVQSLVVQRKALLKNRLFKTQRRERAQLLYNETLIREDYEYNLTEDISTLNYENLGWWNFQMEELQKYEKKKTPEERQMGKRLQSYVNALVEDYIDIEQAAEEPDGQAVLFLWMLKTITDPKDFKYYLKIISGSAENGEFGTALFYLEELLKNGYKDEDSLYSLEHTALLRITPEFNDVVAKYLKNARYDLNEE